MSLPYTTGEIVPEQAYPLVSLMRHSRPRFRRTPPSPFIFLGPFPYAAPSGRVAPKIVRENLFRDFCCDHKLASCHCPFGVKCMNVCGCIVRALAHRPCCACAVRTRRTAIAEPRHDVFHACDHSHLSGEKTLPSTQKMLQPVIETAGGGLA
jgi:hypothetical protein